MFQDCESTFCNNVFMTSTNKSKGKNEIDFNVVFPYVNWDLLQSKLLKPKYFAQKCFVEVLYIWAKGIGIWSVFLGAQTSTPFEVLELLVLNQRGSC
jgi:hypothetical protein